MLTTAHIRNQIKPGKARVEHACGDGIYLVVQPSGAASWAFRYRNGAGKPVKMTLGSFTWEQSKDDPTMGGKLTAADARTLAAAQQRKIAQGADPRAEAKRDGVISQGFADQARLFIETYGQRKQRDWEENARGWGGVRSPMVRAWN
jgi:hypothetical protein